MSTPGLRNNNPGNIRVDPDTTWVGQVGSDSAGFVCFDTPEHGLRAAARVLKNYQLKYGLANVKQIITRWAPPSENDTAAYIKDVCQRLSVEPEDWINLNDPGQLAGLLAAIIRHENGSQPYTQAQIDAGVMAA